MSPGVYLGELVKGIGLFWTLYFFAGFVAFGIFTRHSNAYIILAVWVLLSVGFVGWLWLEGVVTWWTLSGTGVMIAVLVILFFVPLNRNIPPEARELSTQLAAQHPDRWQYAKDLFFTIEKKWTSPTRQYLLEPNKVFFSKDFAYYWHLNNEYVDSNIQARLYRALLLESERFHPDEVRLMYKGCVYSPHTIVAMKKDDHTVYADLWAVDAFPEYEFGMYTTVPCTKLHGRPLDDA